MAKKNSKKVTHPWRKCPLGHHWRRSSHVDTHMRKKVTVSDGWVKYWNEILKPKIPLDPDFVKVMIATESSFNPKAKAYAGKRAGYALGLMQVTEQTVKYLGGHRKELRNHLVHIDQKDLYDPAINIAAGIRWLYRKKQIADAKFKGASWLETVMLYKGYRTMNHPQIKKFIKLYERIKSEKN